MRSPSPPQYAHVNHFRVLKKLVPDETIGKFTHEIELVEDEQGRRWYQKLAKFHSSALKEAIADNIYRYLMPYQPEAIVAQNDSHQTFVLSHEIPGFLSFRLIEKVSLRERILSGEYRGLGSVLMASYFLNEIDLKFANLGVNAEGKIIKIDGNWSFASIRSKRFRQTINECLTERDIRRMPFIVNFKPYNWLDYCIQKVIYNSAHDPKKRHVANAELPLNFCFRQEINEMLLKILLMPKVIAEGIIRAFTDDEKEVRLLVDEISARQQHLHDCAFKNASFREFMQSTQAKECLEDCIVDLRTYKVDRGQYEVIDDEIDLSASLHTFLQSYTRDALKSERQELMNELEFQLLALHPNKQVLSELRAKIVSIDAKLAKN